MTGRSIGRIAIGLVVVGALVVGAPGGAGAETELWETDDTTGRLGANLQMFSAYQNLRSLSDLRQLDPLVPGWGDLPDGAGLGGAVGRLEWAVELGDRAHLDVHNRLVWETTSLDPVFSELVVQGLGVTTGDDRRVDTEVDLVDEEGLRLTHDLDRAVLGLYFDAIDLYLGRQAIRWGVSEMFPVADRFAPLSPFELDTIQRPGIDAARGITTLTPEWELDMVVADRGPDEPLSAGARLQYFGFDFEAYAGGGRFWNRASGLGGISWLLEDWRLFAEGEMLWNLDDSELDRPRATVGARRMAMDWQVGFEYHYNGFGVAPGEGYADAFDQPELGRGETYFLGRHYLGVDGMYFAEPELGTGGGLLVNVVDPSLVVFPILQYEIAQRFMVGAGAYVGFGERPTVEFGDGGEEGVPEVTFPAEFGAVSDLVFVQMTAYY